MVVLFSATVAMAGNGHKSGDRDGTGPDRDQARDGSCTSQVIDHSSNILLAGDCTGDQNKDKDQDRDKIMDCLMGQVIDQTSNILLAKDRQRDKAQKRDGSCTDCPYPCWS